MEKGNTNPKKNAEISDQKFASYQIYDFLA